MRQSGPTQHEIADIFRALAASFPVARALSDTVAAVEFGTIALNDVTLGSASDRPLKEIHVTLAQAYAIGIATLALRAASVRLAGNSFTHHYRLLCADAGFDALDSRVRRRAMYFPIVADDDGFCEIIRYRMYGGQTFALVKTTDDLKNLRFNFEAIDWLPFGGRQ